MKQWTSLSSQNDQNRVVFRIEKCIVEKTLVNIDYCSRNGAGVGDRTIITYVDLKEVEEIKAYEFRDKFFFNFGLDYGRPGSVSLALDILMNGREGNFERYIERDDAAFESAELNSGQWYSNCDGRPDGINKSRRLFFATNEEPENWRQLVELARECRAPKLY